MLQTCLSVPIYSSRLGSSLDQAGITGIQYLPIGMKHVDSLQDLRSSSLSTPLDHLLRKFATNSLKPRINT